MVDVLSGLQKISLFVSVQAFSTYVGYMNLVARISLKWTCFQAISCFRLFQPEFYACQFWPSRITNNIYI